MLAISAEMIASTNGIGKLIFMYGENGNYDYMFAAIACMVIVAFLADRVLVILTKRLLVWHEFGRHRARDEAAMNSAEVRTDAFAWRSAVSILLFIALWEIAARIHVAPAILLPPFSIVAAQLWHSTLDGTLAADLSISLARAFCGLALATGGGVVLGLLMARNRTIEWLVDPLVALGFPSPKIAFIPIFILWFGIESLSKVLLVTFACVFPVIIGTYSAARAREQAVHLVGTLARQQPV